jgi:hypothetical protein
MSNQIPGVPEGWELVRIGMVHHGEWRLMDDKTIEQWDSKRSSSGWAVVLRKIEKPAKYRPFANAEEFKPHRDRWVRQKESGSIFRGITYDEDGLFALLEIAVDPFCWEEAFEDFVFDDDGTPFGVKIDE